jgi:hypothetical protein
MSPTLFLIAKLSRVEPEVARRAMSTATSQDEVDAPRPAEFSRGSGAMAYALALFVSRRPVHFWLGLTGLVAFPIYILARIVTNLLEWGVHTYGQ